jgi:glycine/serine hydroxymethyltransferase
MRKIASFINSAVEESDNPLKLDEIKKEVTALTKKFPLYPELAKW